MLVGRCSWELSDRELQRKTKKSQSPTAATCPGFAVEAELRDLLVFPYPGSFISNVFSATLH